LRFENAGGSDSLIDEVRNYSLSYLKQYLDWPRLEWDNCPFIITDDHPLVEYPGVVTELMGK
jgi:hypothetical protein